MKKNKTKVILECTAPSELTEFNKMWNRQIENDCDRETVFEPNLRCMNHSSNGEQCKHLKLHIYKGG